VEDRDKFFSNFKRKNFISKIIQTWLGAPKGGGGDYGQSRITQPSPCKHALLFPSGLLHYYHHDFCSRPHIPEASPIVNYHIKQRGRHFFILFINLKKE
jgi:hypothetical protein